MFVLLGLELKLLSSQVFALLYNQCLLYIIQLYVLLLLLFLPLNVFLRLIYNSTAES